MGYRELTERGQAAALIIGESAPFQVHLAEEAQCGGERVKRIGRSTFLRVGERRRLDRGKLLSHEYELGTHEYELGTGRECELGTGRM